MEGEDGGRQQVVVMHRATFLATLIGNKRLRATFATKAMFAKILANLCTKASNQSEVLYLSA